MNQPLVYVCPFPLEPLSKLVPHPTPLGCHRAPDLGSLRHTANFHWLSNFTYGNVYISILLSQFVLGSKDLLTATTKPLITRK